jgi:hypothetical protein
LLGLPFETEDGGDVSLLNILTFNGLHGPKFKKIEHFINTTVRTSNPTWDVG